MKEKTLLLKVNKIIYKMKIPKNFFKIMIKYSKIINRKMLLLKVININYKMKIPKIIFKLIIKYFKMINRNII